MNAKESDLATPLHNACHFGDANIVKLLLAPSQSADVDVQNEEGGTPLHLAVKKWENVEIVRRLLEAKAKVISRTMTAQRPFILRARKEARKS